MCVRVLLIMWARLAWNASTTERGSERRFERGVERRTERRREGEEKRGTEKTRRGDSKRECV